MIKMKVTTKLDTSGLKKLRRQLQQQSVNVGYINSKDHWMNEGEPVGKIASYLHYWSPWKGQFMLSESNKQQVTDIIKSELRFLGVGTVAMFSSKIGAKAAKQIEHNIINVTSPPNSKEWVDIKTFNDPLIFGSRIGESPNLISELTFKVGNI
jgi:hypothetical protein